MRIVGLRGSNKLARQKLKMTLRIKQMESTKYGGIYWLDLGMEKS